MSDPEEALWVEALLELWGKVDRRQKNGLGPGMGPSPVRCDLIGRMMKYGGRPPRVTGNIAVAARPETDAEVFYGDINRVLLLMRVDCREVIRKLYSVQMAPDDAARELRMSRSKLYRRRSLAVNLLAPVLRRWGRTMGYVGW